MIRVSLHELERYVLSSLRLDGNQEHHREARAIFLGKLIIPIYFSSTERLVRLA